ncbi:MAG: Alcohol dehydrogenase GroES-like protein [Thermoleophilia bacterium]|nr:Alcohol dehydrogenase GroES-like protein [Thermoleophilia bacterium]
MQALTYTRSSDHPSWSEVARPTIQDATDAVVRITTTTICGSDLHILKGDVPEVTEGRVLGHEAIGVIEELGSAVTSFAVGDRVLISCITSCGRCEQCRTGRYGICSGGGGWILGHTIDGVQADFARIPFADYSLYAVPDALDDEQVLFLADILPTAFEVGVINGKVQPGDTVAIVGAGPVGLAALMTAQLFTPGRIIVSDPLASRRERALEYGADVAIDPTNGDAAAQVLALTDGVGVDVAIEAVGLPATFESAVDMVRAGGRLANIGVHGKPVTLHMERLWTRDVTITTGLVDTWSIPMLLRLVEQGKLDGRRFATHHFDLDHVVDAYGEFGDAATSGVNKVVLHGDALVNRAGTADVLVAAVD